MLISFIISQNKAIPHIQQCIANITERYGQKIDYEEENKKSYYTFPTPQELAVAVQLVQQRLVDHIQQFMFFHIFLQSFDQCFRSNSRGK